jgi:hypothetical protein
MYLLEISARAQSGKLSSGSGIGAGTPNTPAGLTFETFRITGGITAGSIDLSAPVLAQIEVTK